jgi:hypothetical protein
MHTEGYRLLSPFRIALTMEKVEWKPYRNALSKTNLCLLACSLAHLYTRMHQEVKVLSVISNSFFPF